ncbi:MAG TPA: hypothetical protein VMU89_24070 [Thermomicrobiaceae bacterium]|nr:hypothetical protein [Thermomicrobiaceae bacterium]
MDSTNPTWRFKQPGWLASWRAGLPYYRLPPTLMARVGYASLRGRQRDLRRDVDELIAGTYPAPVVVGLEHVPRTGRCVIVANHYERPDGAWVGWGAIVITAALAHHRPGAPAARWVMTSTWADCYFGPRRIAPERLHGILQRFAAVYGVILMPASDLESAGRAVALRSLFRALDADAEAVVALHPEAGGFETLIVPPPGAGRVLAALERRDVPLLPVGVSEQDGRLTVRFGPALAPGVLRGLSDSLAAATVMETIAELVPPETRGAFRDGSASEPHPVSGPARTAEVLAPEVG